MCVARWQAFQQRRCESRFADPRFAGEQYHLAFAGLCLRPAPKQQFKFFFSPNKVGQAARVESLEAACHRSLSQCGPSPYRPGDALEVLWSQVLKLEKIAQKLSSALRDDHAVRLSDALQARRKVRRLANDCLLLGIA